MLRSRFHWFDLLAAFAIGAACANAGYSVNVIVAIYRAARDWMRDQFLTIASLAGTPAGVGVSDQAILAIFRDEWDPTNTGANLFAPA